MSFTIPVRVRQLKPRVSTALLMAIASTTAVFAATPFLLSPIAAEYDRALSTVGWVATTQLLGFVIASWIGGRYLRPVRSVFVIGTLIGVVANLASAAAPTFELLAAARFASGLALGLAAWIAWQEAFGDDAKTGDVAVVGPLIGIVAAPAFAAILQFAGLPWLFVVLALLSATPLPFARQVPRVDRLRPHRTRHAATRAARVILFALGAITLGGSSVFVYAAAIGEDLDGLSPLTVALVFSGNALASIPAAKWTGKRGTAGVWFLATAACALVLAVSRSGVLFSVALVTWGFVFFMGVPAAFSLLAARSRFPNERAGDAQAVMAFGRVIGPLIGGALLATGSTGTLGLVAAGIIAAASALLLYVDRDRFVVARQYFTPTVTTSVDALEHTQ